MYRSLLSRTCEQTVRWNAGCTSKCRINPKSDVLENFSCTSHPSFSEWLCRDVMLTKAVMSQPAVIVQKAGSIVLVSSARARVMSHFLQGCHDIALSLTRVVGLKKLTSIYLAQMIRNKVRGMGLNRRASKKITDSRRLRLSHEEDCLDPFVRLFCLPDVWGDFFTSGKYLCSENS